MAAGLVQPVVEDLIIKSNPDWSGEGFICMDDLNRFRNQYVLSLAFRKFRERRAYAALLRR